jgi:cyclopropane-fatty-acyl-phospholipid synthase
MGYTCAYFERDDMTLEEAQNAKFDLALGKLDLEPGMTVLDVGCGWGGALQRAVEKFDVNVIGITLSLNQFEYCKARLAGTPTQRNIEVRLQGWEEFDEPVDRILSIEAFEHFGFERYDEFLTKCFSLLPADGRMTIQSNISYHPDEFRARGIPLSIEVLKFIKFMVTAIFPGARLPSSDMMGTHAQAAGFTVGDVVSLREHYVKTLTLWGDALEANKSRAIEIQSEEVYDNYMKYLRGCAQKFADEYIDVQLVTYLKGAAA